MANRQELVIPSKDVKIFMNVNGIPLQLDTSARLSKALAQTLDDIYAIGQKDPIAVSDTNATYTVNLSLQSGEYHMILDAVNGALPAGSELYASWLQFPPFTITYSHQMKNLITPTTVSTSFLNCKVSDDGEDISANDSQTITTIGLRGTGIKRNVAPIA